MRKDIDSEKTRLQMRASSLSMLAAQGETYEADAERESAAAHKSAAIERRLNSLPADLGRNRILSSDEAAAFWGVSLPHWRRLYRAGKVPAPIRVGERKLGWLVGTLADGVAARAAA